MVWRAGWKVRVKDSTEFIPVELLFCRGNYWGGGRRRELWSRRSSMQRASTTRLWSSRWGRPETVTLPMMPVPVTWMGKLPPWVA